MSKKLLFISKDNLTTNPRLQKELKLAVSIGYEVDFIGFYSGNWSDDIDKEITQNIDANFYYIPATRKPFFPWLISTLKERILQKIYPYFKNSIKINAFAHSKRTILLCKHLTYNEKKYDLIIAHTLASLYPAYKLSKKLKIPFIFDIEDYHPGEIISTDAQNETVRRIFLMKKLLTKAALITYASPLIGKESLKLLNNFKNENHQLINNCFSNKEFQFKENKSEKIKFVWFSQNIAAGRGLELVIPALANYKDKIELNLIGNLYQNFHRDFLSKYFDFIKIHKPLPQKELNLKLSEFDIGLAIELVSADLNRNICLTNKIFAYAQSGLYVLATDTSAQKLFIKEHENVGVVSAQNVEEIQKQISMIIQNINLIRKEKKKRFEYAQNLAWEIESKKLIGVWSNLLTT